MDDSDHPLFLRRPHIGRIYDYILGGSLNTPLDRAVAEELTARTPAVVSVITSQRQFLTAAVSAMLDGGVRQFVELGSGLPTAGHVHHIAHRRAIPATTVYVDNDPNTVAQADIILENNPHATVVAGDLTQPHAVVDHLDRDTAIDRRQPVGLLLVGTLDSVADLAGPADLLAAYRAAFPHGFHLAITLLTTPASSAARSDIDTAAQIFGGFGATLVTRPRRTLHSWLSRLRPRGTAVETGFTLPDAETAAVTFDFAVVRYAER